jgi:hypothetical protein
MTGVCVSRAAPVFAARLARGAGEREKEALECKNVLYFRGAEENSKLYTSLKFTASLSFKKENRGYLFTTFVQLAVFSFKAGQERNLLINFELFLCAHRVCVPLAFVCM